ncbi:MAG: hypothetical protein AAFQ89_02090, partial [Cyanobacteria bacterium J06626_18]
PNAVNHLEIEVKDVGDGWKDSAVFLQAGSLGVSETPLGSFDFFANESTLLEGSGSVLNLKLNTLPTETVTITLDPDVQIDLGNGAGNPFDVVFTPEDALTNRHLMFTAFDDTLVEGAHSGFITATVQSNDPSYTSLEGRTIEQLIVDNDIDPVGGIDPLLSGGQTEEPVSTASPTATFMTTELTDTPFTSGATAPLELALLDSDPLAELSTLSVLPISTSMALF